MLVASALDKGRRVGINIGTLRRTFNNAILACNGSINLDHYLYGAPKQHP